MNLFSSKYFYVIFLLLIPLFSFAQTPLLERPITLKVNNEKTLNVLELIAKQVVEGFILGLHKSPFHGFSVEFAEHRIYNPGESTRHIDWKVYGRSDKLFTKKYEEETNLRCQIIIDNSASMHYPELDKKNTEIGYGEVEKFIDFTINSTLATPESLSKSELANWQKFKTDKTYNIDTFLDLWNPKLKRLDKVEEWDAWYEKTHRE